MNGEGTDELGIVINFLFCKEVALNECRDTQY